MVARVRVHELAQDLGISCDDILDFLDDVGVKVRSRSSVLAESVQGRIRGKFAPDTLIRAPRPSRRARRLSARRTPVRHHDQATTMPTAPAPSTTPPAAASTPPAAAVPAAVGPDVLFLAPGALPAPAPRTATRASDPAHRSPLPTQRAPEPDPEAEAMAEAAALAGWIRREFTEPEFLRWQEAGLAVDESALADQCRTAGIEPDQLSLTLSGRTALLRLRGGETATSVWARIAEGEQYRSRGNRLGGRFALS